MILAVVNSLTEADIWAITALLLIVIIPSFSILAMEAITGNLLYNYTRAGKVIFLSIYTLNSMLKGTIQVVLYIIIKLIIYPQYSDLGLAFIILLFIYSALDPVVDKYVKHLHVKEAVKIQKKHGVAKSISPYIAAGVWHSSRGIMSVGLLMFSVLAFLTLNGDFSDKDRIATQLESLQISRLEMIEKTQLLSNSMSRIVDDINDTKSNIDSITKSLSKSYDELRALEERKLVMENRIVTLENELNGELEKNVMYQAIRNIISENTMMGIVIAFLVGYFSSIFSSFTTEMIRNLKNK